MPKFTPNGVSVYLQDAGSNVTPPTPITITSISNAKPAVATVAAADITKVDDGDILMLTSPSTPSIDGMPFVVNNKEGTANTFELAPADLTGLAGPVTDAKATVVNTDTGMFLACLTEWNWEREAADAIDTTTFCGAESIAGTSAPGTVTITAFLNFDEAYMFEWMEAVRDGIPRLMRVVYPDKAGGGEALFVITPSGFTQGMTVNEAATFEGTAVVNKEPQFLVGPNKVAAMALKRNPPPPPEPEDELKGEEGIANDTGPAAEWKQAA